MKISPATPIFFCMDSSLETVQHFVSEENGKLGLPHVGKVLFFLEMMANGNVVIMNAINVFEA